MITDHDMFLLCENCILTISALTKHFRTCRNFSLRFGMVTKLHLVLHKLVRPCVIHSLSGEWNEAYVNSYAVSRQLLNYSILFIFRTSAGLQCALEVSLSLVNSADLCSHKKDILRYAKHGCKAAKAIHLKREQNTQ